MSDHRTGSSGRRRAGTLVWVSAGLVVAVALGVGGYAVLAGEGGRTGGARTSDVAVVSVMDFDISTKATGELQAKNQIELRNDLETNSTIVELVEEGKFVKKGDMLVRLNEEEVRNKLEEQQLKLEEATNQLIAARNNLEIQKSENESRRRQAELKLELAKLELSKWREGDVEQTRLASALAVEKAKRDVERLRDKCARNVELLEKKFISKEQSDLDKLSLAEAEAALKRAELDVQIYETYTYPKEEKSKLSDVEEARAELERVERQNEIELASKEADLLSKQRSVNIHRQRLEKLEKQLAACTIVAPTDGLVVYGTSLDSSRWDDQGPLQIGAQVKPNELLIGLPDTSEMIAEVRVPESVAGRVRVGQPALVTVNAIRGEQFRGEVLSKGVLAESGGWRDPNSREYTVRIALEEGEGIEQLKPSMRCEAEIILGRAEGVPAMPITALFRDGPVSYVYRPVGNDFRRVPVKAGRISNSYAEVLAGLSEGDLVLVRTPSPGEVIQEEWNPEELRIAGFTLDEEGNPRRASGRPGFGAGRRPPGAAEPAIAGKSDTAQAERGRRADGGESEEQKTQPVAAEAAATPTPTPASDPSEGD